MNASINDKYAAVALKTEECNETNVIVLLRDV
jgi:hypothetical protein